MTHTGIDLSKYSMEELEIIKGIFEHEFQVIGRKEDGTMICKRIKRGGANGGSDLEPVRDQQ